jgi:hypothetical protein
VTHWDIVFPSLSYLNMIINVSGAGHVPGVLAGCLNHPGRYHPNRYHPHSDTRPVYQADGRAAQTLMSRDEPG